MKKFILLLTLILCSTILLSCNKQKQKEEIFSVVFIVDEKDYAKYDVFKNDLVDTPKEPIKQGYEFKGWYLLNRKYDFNKVVTSDLIITAKFEKDVVINTYKVIFDSQNDNSYITQSVLQNNKVTKPLDPIKPGFKFVGWYNEDILYDFNKVVTSNLKLIAKYSKVETIENDLFIFEMKVDDTYEILKVKDKEIKNIDIPLSYNDVSITSIGQDAFSNCNKLVSITLPTSITQIKTNAFKNCDNLKSISISKSVLVMGSDIFKSCSRLTIYLECKEIPKTFSSDWNMYGCEVVYGFIRSGSNELYDYIIQDNNEVILTNYKGSSKEVEVASNISIDNVLYKVVGINKAFSYSDIVSITLPDSIKTIAPRAFLSCYELKSVKTGEGIKSIGALAFYGCENLESINLVTSIISINELAFAYCNSLKNLYITTNIKYVGANAFEECLNLSIYTQFNSIPPSWDMYFNPNDCNIYFSYFKN